MRMNILCENYENKSQPLNEKYTVEIKTSHQNSHTPNSMSPKYYPSALFFSSFLWCSNLDPPFLSIDSLSMVNHVVLHPFPLIYGSPEFADLARNISSDLKNLSFPILFVCVTNQHQLSASIFPNNFYLCVGMWIGVFVCFFNQLQLSDIIFEMNFKFAISI
jgi:hypothetical protein